MSPERTAAGQEIDSLQQRGFSLPVFTDESISLGQTCGRISRVTTKILKAKLREHV
jgi:hypothetical protein